MTRKHRPGTPNTVTSAGCEAKISSTPGLADGKINGPLSASGNSKTSPDEIKIGYGAPPAATQWKKGQSGNPKGRTKGARNMKTVMHNWANGKVRVKVNGRPRTLSNLEAHIERLHVQGLSGNIRASALLLQLVQQYVPEALDEGAGHVLTPEDLALLKSRASYMALIEQFDAVEGAKANKKDEEDGDA